MSEDEEDHGLGLENQELGYLVHLSNFIRKAEPDERLGNG